MNEFLMTKLLSLADANSGAGPPATNLRAIAKVACVSHVTVSLALRNHPRVSESTRQRIRALADKMGYRPNALVSALMSHVGSNRRVVDQEVVAFLTGGPTPDWAMTRPNVRQNYLGAQTRAEQLGFRLETFWMGPGGENAPATAKILRTRSVRGVIVAPLPVPHAANIALDWPHLAATTIGYSFEQVPLHRAASQDVNGMILVYEKLRQLGYRRIGLATSVEDMMRVKYYWLSGLLTGQELFGGERVPHVTYEVKTEKDRFHAWYRKHRPDVIVGVTRDNYFWLKEAGIRIPQDVGYAQLNLLDDLTDKVSGIWQQSFEIGAAAMDLLVTQLHNNEYGSPITPTCTLIDSRWMGGTTAPARR